MSRQNRSSEKKGPRQFTDWQCPNTECQHHAAHSLCFGSRPNCPVCGSENPQRQKHTNRKQGHTSTNSNAPTHRGRGKPNDKERKFFDKMTKDVEAKIDNVNDAHRFLKAAIAFANTEDDSALLYRLDLSNALEKAIEYIGLDSDGLDVCLSGFLPLLQRLAGADLHKPVYQKPLSNVLAALWSKQYSIEVICDLLTRGDITDEEDLATLTWFFTRLAVEHQDVRENENVQLVTKVLVDPCLRTVMDGTAIYERGVVATQCMSVMSALDTDSPGGRHDNDAKDFRSVQILPTLQEFLCPKPPYLPKFVAAPHTLTAAHLLDRQFRLLREDMLGPAKADQNDPRKLQRDLFYSLRVSRIYDGSPKRTRDGKPIPNRGPTDPCICFSFTLPRWHRVTKMKPGEKAQFWEKSRRCLPKDALVCLLREDANDHEWKPVRFATIKRRDVDELAGKTASRLPEIGLSFFSFEDLSNTIKELSEKRFVPETRLLVVSSSLFAYDPVLKGLQSMSTIPFEAEILRGEPAPLVRSSRSSQRNGRYSHHEQMSYGISGYENECDDDYMNETTEDYHPTLPASLSSKVDNLDSSQKKALDLAMTNRVALIQGPPGTGKTYLGVILAQAILESTDKTILCVCYTNHALDSFLADLLDVGITEIVRLGGRSKNERLAQYNLQELNKAKSSWDKSQTARYAQLMQTITDEQKLISKLKQRLQVKIGWEDIKEHLQPDEFRQLGVHPRDLIDDEGYERPGLKGLDALWQIWLKGKKPPHPFENRSNRWLWRMNQEARKRQKRKWQDEISTQSRDDLAESLMIIQEAKLEIRKLQGIKDGAILSQKRVIGCTTTKAAMCKDILDNIAAEVVMVEEAAEILEAHVLTSLSERCRHLIMIGDHKQLRPKAEHYPLSVESKKGFDLNRSLFERLAGVLPLATLSTQHRMHPDISRIPRCITYPSLKDSPSVNNHPQVKGLIFGLRTCFLHHNEPEDRRDALSDHTAAVSKTNKHEVKWVVAIVRYMLQQGYKSTDLVVLTPYLGQLLKIQEGLSAADLNVAIGESDFNEANKALAGIEGFNIQVGAVKDADSSVRVATIDNYQGEEANIVIVSLVRSNPESTIGFLKEPERVNVLLSRAKYAQILIGNSQTLIGASGGTEPLHGGMLWKKICTNMNVLQTFPARCETHNEVCFLKTPEQFETHCPEGGCTQLCDKLLAKCRHLCKKQCHVGPCNRPCEEMVGDKCGQGHTLSRKCSQGPPKCKHVVEDKCSDGHVITRPCHKPVQQVQCEQCKIILRKELEKEQALEKARILTEQKAIEQARKDADTEIARITAMPSNNTRLFKRELTCQGPDALEYNNVKDRVERSRVHDFDVAVVKIEVLVNLSLEKKWHEARKEMIDPSRRPDLLFHGTNVIATNGIAKKGFRKPPRKDTNMFGQGVYFATDSTKSANEVYTAGSNRILLCDVLLGSCCTVPGLGGKFPLQQLVRKQKHSSNVFLDATLATVRKSKFDSVYGLRGTDTNKGVKYDEMIIYDERLALPRYIVHFNTSPKPAPVKLPQKPTTLFPNKNYAPNSPEDYAFRTAESQFLRMMARAHGSHQITQVDYCPDPALETAFKSQQKKYDQKYGPKNHEMRLAFHGTTNTSMQSIVKSGFKLNKVGSATDSGWYGAGIYFSANTATSLGYNKVQGQLLLCQLLLGKSFAVPGLMNGAPCKAGYDSHVVNSEDEIVMFNMDAILPTYIIHFT